MDHERRVDGKGETSAMTDEVRIRPRRREDTAALRALLGEFERYLNAIEPLSLDPEACDRLARMGGDGDPFGRVHVADAGGDVVGYMNWHLGVWEEYRALYIADLFVRESARGRGVGEALIHEAQRLAAEAGAERLAWSVWRKNAAAIAFYERIGATRNEEEMQMVLPVEAAERARA